MLKIIVYTSILVSLSYSFYAQKVSPILIEKGIIEQQCTSAGVIEMDKNPYIGISKILARSANAEGLSNWIQPRPCWGMSLPDATYPTIKTVEQSHKVPVNCSPPYDKCWSNYCPEKYAQIIQSLVDMKATIILRAVNTWGRSDEMFNGSEFYTAMQQMVVDINSAYDCAGLQRPIIQNSFFEWCDFKSDWVKIPLDILNEFKNEEDFDFAYYFNETGKSRNRPFTNERIINGKEPFANSPNISKLEARMWMYYCCKIYIDLGYTSIHMGQMLNWAYYDKEENYKYTVPMIRKIRQYAASKNQLLLLSEENYKAVKIPGTDTFLYDFDSRAIKPREISNPRVCGDWECNTPLDNYLIGSPCEDEKYPAIIDQCVVEHYGNSGGIAPNGKGRYDLMPYNTYFDLSLGIHPHEGEATSGCKGLYSTWGYDDTKWLVQKISPECRAFFLKNAVSRLRTFSEGNGFLAIPELIVFLNPELYPNGEKNINPTAQGFYLLSDESLLHQDIHELWQGKSIKTVALTKYNKKNNGKLVPYKDKSSKKIVQKITINHPDNTSIYSWTIIENGMEIIKDKVGKEIFFELNNTSNNYTIKIRQDNLGGIDAQNITIEYYTFQL